MKLTETTLLRNYMKIIKENQILDQLDSNKLEAVQNIVRKHTGVIYYSQIAGLMKVDRVSDKQAQEVFDALEKETGVQLVDDLSNIPAKVGIGPSDLNAEQRAVYEKFTDRDNINDEVVERILLSGFENGEISSEQWLTLTSNLLSTSHTNERIKPAFVARDLYKAGVSVEDDLSGPGIGQKTKTTQNNPSETKLNQNEKDSATVINFLVARATDGSKNKVRKILSGAVREVELAKAQKQNPIEGDVWYMLPDNESKFLQNNVSYHEPDMVNALRNLGIMYSP